MRSAADLIAPLHVVHSTDLSRPLVGSGDWLHIRTCQRELIVADARPDAAGTSSAENLRGTAAYRFLLETIAGLNSSVPGETNVQGQFRRQWQSWRHHAASSRPTAVWTDQLMHRLCSDSNAIRAEFLQGIGGHSYGSLVRKMLAPAAHDRLLFVGMGELAQSMLELFAGFECGVWNRHALTHTSYPQLQVFAPADWAAAADWATQLIFTTPPDAANDTRWATAIRGGQQQVVHLGRRRDAHGPWVDAADAGRFRDLDDLFTLQAQQSDRRLQQLLLARCACARRAAELQQPRNTVPAHLSVQPLQA